MATATSQNRTRRPGGRQLARIASRTSQARSREITNWAEFRAASVELRDSIASRGAQLWQAIGLAMIRTDLVAKDLSARIKALESELAGKATAKAAPAKAAAETPLRIRLMRAIDDESVAPLLEKIKAARGRDVKLTLMSEGGMVEPAFKLAREIVRHGAVDCHATVSCDSATILLLAAGRRRSALKDCSLFFHRPSLSGRDAETPSEARQLDEVAKNMAAFIAKRCGGKPSAFLKFMTPDGNRLDPGQASLMGLINDIVRRPHVPRKASKS